MKLPPLLLAALPLGLLPACATTGEGGDPEGEPQGGELPADWGHGTAVTLWTPEQWEEFDGGQLDASIQVLRRSIGQLEESLANLERLQDERDGALVQRASAEQVLAYRIAQPWIEATEQEDDSTRRAEALEWARGALLGADGDEALAALILLGSLGETDLELAPFRELVLPHAESAQPSRRIAALYALHATGPEPSDLDLVIELVADPSPVAAQSVPHLLVLFAGGDLRGRAGEVVADLLASDDYIQVNATLTALQDTVVSPAVEALVVEIAGSPGSELAHERALRASAIRHALSTFENKSEDTVWTLIRALGDPAPVLRERALAGLERGVPPELHSQVAEALIEHTLALGNAEEQLRCLDVLGRYGGPEHLAELRALAADE